MASVFAAPDLYRELAAVVALHPQATLVGGQEGLRWRTVQATEFLDRVNGLATYLASPAVGVRPGDRLVYWLPNHWWSPVYFFAAWRLGAVVVPFDREMNVEGAAKILAQIEPRAIITGNGVPPWAGDCPVREWREPLAGECLLPLPDTSASDGLAAIYYTSGTTGNPKGCQLGHDNLRYQVETIYGIVPVGPGVRIASILPVSHVFELTVGLLYPILCGAAVHYVPSRRGEDIVRVLSEQHITHMLVVPQILNGMYAATDKRLHGALPGPLYGALMAVAARSPMGVRRRLFRSVHQRIGGQLQCFVSGGAALPPDVHAFWQRLGIRVVQGYGASECSPLIAGGDLQGRTPYGSVGKVIAGTQWRLGADGELQVNGPGVFRGYWKDPERTAQVLGPDGWYATGDLVRLDKHDNVFIEGRARDLIVLPSGMKVWPEDVEAVLKDQPAVKDAVVMQVKQATGAGSLHAYLVPNAQPDPAVLAAIVAAANQRLAQHQRVATASWWPEDDFPRTALGKVRRQLITPPDAQITAPLAASNGVVGLDDLVARSVAEVAHRPSVADADTLSALGLDSLTLAELASSLEERTGHKIPEAVLQPSLTVAQLREVVGKLATGESDAASLAVLDLNGRPVTARAEVEAKAWHPPFWLYTRGRFLRRLSWPITLLHRHFVPRVYLVGAEGLKQLPRSVVFAATHRSFADVPTLQRAFRESPAHDRWNRFVIAAAGGIVADAGVAGRFVTAAYGLFPLRQYSEREASLQQLAKVIDAGNSLVMFPQGHHTLPADEVALTPLSRFQPGAAFLAMQLGLPVVPVGIAGDELVVPGRVPPGYKGMVVAGIAVKLQRHSVAVAFGPALSPLPGEAAPAFTARIEAAAFLLARRAQALLENKD